MRKAFSAALVLMLVLAAVAVYLRMAERAPEVTALPETHYVRAAHWFGGEWAINFWNTNLEARAEADFAAIRDDGFNTVVLLVPWPAFAPDPRSGELDMPRVERLRGLIRLAGRMGVQVILRVPYSYDGLDQERGWRNYRVWVEDEVYQGWLDFLESIWREVGSEPNLLFGFFSWEDLWRITRVLELGPGEKLRAARASGYTDWLRERFTLAEVSGRYRRDFEEWGEVEVPDSREPALELFLEFVSEEWIERFFIPAQQRFPKLSMEIRIDAEAIYDGDEQVGWYFYESSWDLPGVNWVTVYWAPSMGGENEGELLSPETAAERLEWWLERISDRAGPRQIFIGQFLVEDFTPGYEKNGRIPRDQVPEFLSLAEGVLGRLAAGYGLWTWTDYGHNMIANPEFYVGLEGWEYGGGVRAGDEGVHLARGAWMSYPIPLDEFDVPGGYVSLELCVSGRALAGDGARVRFHDSHAGADLGGIEFFAEEGERCVNFDAKDFVRVELRALDDVLIRRVGSVDFIQESGMRDLEGNLKPVGEAYIDLNSALVERPLITRPLYEDGWMDRYLVTRLEPTEDATVLRLDTYLPESWPEQPMLTVSVNGAKVDRVPCVAGGEYVFPVDVDFEVGRAVEVSIEASEVHEPAGDSRRLGCLISQLELTQ